MAAPYLAVLLHHVGQLDDQDTRQVPSVADNFLALVGNLVPLDVCKLPQEISSDFLHLSP